MTAITTNSDECLEGYFFPLLRETLCCGVCDVSRRTAPYMPLSGASTVPELILRFQVASAQALSVVCLS